jgi:hypothetical protein
MGSTGSGNFGDYTPEAGDRCGLVVQMDLEDVARSAYWMAQKAVPPTHTPVKLQLQP